MFSLYDTLLSNVRDVDDELNIVASGVLTGATYASPHGLHRMLKSGAIGMGLSLAYVLYKQREYVTQLVSSKTD